MDDVADRAGVGRTSLYRKFSGRDELVYAVLAREVRTVFAAVTEVAAGYDRLEDKVVEGALVALRAVEGSLVSRLIDSDPSTFLPFLTTDAGPLLALARELLISQAIALGAEVNREEAAELAELAARLGLSFVLTRATVFPTDDPAAARRTLHRVLGPSSLRWRRPTTGGMTCHSPHDNLERPLCTARPVRRWPPKRGVDHQSSTAEPVRAERAPAAH